MSQPQTIDDISLAPEMRLKTGMVEFDRTLGGGIVPGSVVLIGGDPGIGKSTLILQVLDKLALTGPVVHYIFPEKNRLSRSSSGRKGYRFILRTSTL